LTNLRQMISLSGATAACRINAVAHFASNAGSVWRFRTVIEFGWEP